MSSKIRNRFLAVTLSVIAGAQVAMAQSPEEGRGRESQPSGQRQGQQQGERILPADLTFDLGVATIPDRETFEKLSYQGPMRMDAYLSDIECVKFIIENAMSENFRVYWMNTNTYQAHPQFMGRIGMPGGPGGRGRGGQGGGQAGGPGGGTRVMRGAVTFHPRQKAPDGSVGLYIFDFQPNDRFTFDEIKFARDAIVKTMPYVQGKIAFHPLQGNVSLYSSEKAKYDESDVAVYRDEDIYKDIGFLPLNAGTSFGRLKLMDDSLPTSRDIVLCKTLPNQLPRVAGVITAVRQTPLSHVNLRAVQDKVPNAYVADAMESKEIQALLGKFVSYTVTDQGYKLREATPEEVEKHFADKRPSQAQPVPRDLTKQEVLPLAQIQFADSTAFGVKAANLAVMQSFGFPEGQVPAGMAIPFYYYDEFMKHNGFYESFAKEIGSDDFRNSREVQERTLENFRKQIIEGKTPDWMMEKLASVQNSFPAGTPIRCRSSTNNEDLPGFSGAGLYDSFTHDPDEGHLIETVKKVFASLWNYRAFEERDFYRVDHFQAAMGVVLHPNFKGELANGVAVTDDILYGTDANYYLNVQVGEDLVTNPDAESSPEEILLAWYKEDGDQIVRKTADGKPLMTSEQLDELRSRLAKIHAKFAKLYGKGDQDKFAMEIEFKISKEGKLVIKQARPWVF